MIYWLIFLGLSVLFIAYMSFEVRFLEVKRVEFTKNKNCLKVLQLSDIHIHRLKVSDRKIKQVIEREKADFIIMTGDYIENKKHKQKLMNFLQYIICTNKVFMCLGNHDYEAFEKDEQGLKEYINELNKLGVTILHNASTCFEKNSKKYNIIGVEDMRYGLHDLSKALDACSDNAFLNLAFTHNPDLVLEIPKGKVDYLFCGHFHGGQIWAPFDLEFKILRAEKLCKMGVKRGLHKLNGVNLYINRGLGNVCLPFRFMSRPEITVFYLP